MLFRSVSLNGKDSDLKKHLGHKVQITGQWEPSSSPSSPTSSSSTAGTSGANGSLKVSSIKMLSESCSTH